MDKLSIEVTPREIRLIAWALGDASASSAIDGDLNLSYEFRTLGHSLRDRLLPCSDYPTILVSETAVMGSLPLQKGSSRGVAKSD